ncbi:virulence RhuM family protein [Lentibacillus sp. N15]|uniref:virulence RhuM family protein n=1 Tax=Lentibacillus songyuanensis TaxID=3136161 RepID=UPI0031BA2705
MQNKTDILIYQTEDGNTKIDVRLENETVWMTQKAIAELYQTSPQNITLHIKNIYEEAELQEESTCKYYLQVQNEGSKEVTRKAKHYNLEMILAIGYRVRSHRGTQFRKWATERLNEYLVKGFTMDDDRLKEMRNFGQDYFDELLERIRDIRASEKRFYQNITDIYATSVDYDSKAEITQDFFATVQNKLHFAIHGQTAAELIVERAKSEKENMGLTSWKGDKVRKRDVIVAKNYLTEKELKSLNRIVTMYLDYAEDQAERQQPMHMKDWIDKLNAFLQFNDREILENAGKISKTVADKLAIQEYEKYNQERITYQSNDDFERFIENNDLKK